jgi:hypothetical protein
VNFPVRVTGRRQDLYEAGPEQEIPTPHASLMAGHWELSAQAGADKYIESIGNSRGELRHEGQPEKVIEWFDIFIEARYSSRIRIVVADKAAQITGTITKEGKAVPGAPVFLWPLAESARRSLKGYRMVIADNEGKYHFEGLPPGDYRMLATYDYTDIDEAALDEGLAITVHADESQKTSADLPLWTVP